MEEKDEDEDEENEGEDNHGFRKNTIYTVIYRYIYRYIQLCTGMYRYIHVTANPIPAH